MSFRFTPQFALRTAALLLFWLLLSESLEPWHVAAGIASALLVASLNAGSGRPAGSPRVRWLKALAYAPWLFVRVFASGLHVAFLLLHPRLPIKPKLARYRHGLGNETALALLGNSITLTPGTITVDSEDAGLVVHSLSDSSASDLSSGRLQGKVAALFGGEGSRG